MRESLISRFGKRVEKAPNEDFFYRTIDAGEVVEWDRDKCGWAAWVFVRGVCDASGTRLFSDADAEAGFNIGIAPHVERISKLNGMDGEPGKA